MLGKNEIGLFGEENVFIFGHAVVEVSTGHPGGRCVTNRQIVDGKGELRSEARAEDTRNYWCSGNNW